MSGPPEPHLFGRDRPLGLLRGQLGRLVAGGSATIFVAGEAGVGKTTLVRAAVAEAADAGARVAWGTCVDVDGAPGYWPWSQALGGLVRLVGDEASLRAAGEDVAVLAHVVRSFGPHPRTEPTGRDRLVLMDAVGRFVGALATEAPVVVVLDDLQWADESSLDLLDFLVRSPSAGPVGVIGAYRQGELAGPVRARVSQLVGRAEHLSVQGLDAAAAARLVEAVTGRPVSRAAAAAIHRRTGGHPFFVREVARLMPTLDLDRTAADGTAADGTAADGTGPVPAAVRDAIERRLAMLDEGAREVLAALAVLAGPMVVDVVAAALGMSQADVEAAAAVAVEAGVLTGGAGREAFVHDLWRETVAAGLAPEKRAALHLALAPALERRRQRGAEVAAADLARHFTAAVGLDGPDRAVHWTLVASATDMAALAFAEAAGHVQRLRHALAAAALDIDHERLVDLLVVEADALARAGSTEAARELLGRASAMATSSAGPDRVAAVALATARLGARFASRRDEVIRPLERALAAVEGAHDVWEARVAAALARELAHSVPEDRPRAGPLSERALVLGRRSGDDATRRACLLARHDVLWAPGTGPEREAIARELAALALSAGDHDGHAEALLLLANALLEQGSSAFEAPLVECLTMLAARGQPRQRYTVVTRQACLALCRGPLEDADDLIEEAAALGARIREPDTANVRMSQRLELVRARGRPAELLAFAAEAVGHWTGAPVHAHGVAAGFSARAGDLGAARHHLAAVADLGTWRADRSYLRSVFVRELAWAAIAVDDRSLAADLLEDLVPLGPSCGVNGAVVAFAGSHAHTAGLLAAALGRSGQARDLLDQAARTYDRLGARIWAAELARHPLVGGPVTAGSGTARGAAGMDGRAVMSRRGGVWHVSFEGRDATLAHSKGLADIARLLSGHGQEVHVLDLVGSADRSGPAGDVVDRRGIDAYRRRLADISAEIDEAERNNDPGRREWAEAERHAVLDELEVATGLGGRPRPFSNHPAERARKAVAGRVRDAIAKLHLVHPELAAHLDSHIVTGTYCRYRPGDVHWDVDAGP